MKPIGRRLWTAGMITVLLSGVQTLTAGPPKNAARFNPDPDYCVRIDKAPVYRCTYGPADCRICYYEGGNVYSCVAEICE